jgi:hypothetical protein
MRYLLLLALIFSLSTIAFSFDRKENNDSLILSWNNYVNHPDSKNALVVYNLLLSKKDVDTKIKFEEKI